MQSALSQRRLVALRFVRAVMTVGSVCVCGAVVVTLLLMANFAAAAEDETGFEPIFDGKTLDGWDGDPKIWSVKDGALVGEATAENMPKDDTFCVWRKGTVDDFVLRMEIKINGKGPNSGVQYRSKEFEKWKVGGYQADWDKAGVYVGTLYEQPIQNVGRHSLAKGGTKVVIDADGKKEITKIGNFEDMIDEGYDPDGWNQYEIAAEGNHLTHKVNGKLFMECLDNQVDKRAMSGIVAVQVHGDRVMKVEFKNIRLKRLKP